METSVSLGIHALALSLSVHHATHRLTVILHWRGGSQVQETEGKRAGGDVPHLTC